MFILHIHIIYIYICITYIIVLVFIYQIIYEIITHCHLLSKLAALWKHVQDSLSEISSPRSSWQESWRRGAFQESSAFLLLNSFMKVLSFQVDLSATPFCKPTDHWSFLFGFLILREGGSFGANSRSGWLNSFQSESGVYCWEGAM